MLSRRYGVTCDVRHTLLVSSSFLPGRGGIERYLGDLCDELRPTLAVLAPATRAGLSLPQGLGYETIPFPGPLLFPGRRAFKAIHEAARACATDKVLFGSPWPLALLGPRLKRSGLRYAVIVHGAELVAPAAVPGLSALVARSLARADVLFAVSEFTRGRLRSLLADTIGAPPIELLRARVDLSRFAPGADGRFREGLGLNERHKLILSFGRLVARKGVHRLVDAMPALSERVPEAVLVVAGTGPQKRRLEGRAARRAGHVVFTGPVPEQDAAALYAAADVFVLPVADRWLGLDVEGLGVALLEAQACATPCVTGRSGGTPEAVIDGETGFVIDARSRDSLVDKIAWLLEHPEAAARMGAAGRAHVAERFARSTPPKALLEWLDNRRSI